MKDRISLIVWMWFAICPFGQPASGAAYPLKVSSNKRYLVDQNNVPFLVQGESPQALIGNLSTSEASTYFSDRQSRGFNTHWVNLLCTSYTGCSANGQTFDNIAPFTTGSDPSSYDLTTPNETYFARVDAMINLAATYGQVIFLDPIETGGWLITLQNNGTTKAFNYGVFLGNRYKTFPNIVWMSGNDFQSWSSSSTDNNLVKEVMRGIASVDSNHLQTIELDCCPSYSNQDAGILGPYISVDSAYTYFETYDYVLTAYNSSPTLPVIMIEANYEGENNTGQAQGSPKVLRLQEWWSATAGSTAGQFFGNHYTWSFLPNWQNNLNTTGANEFKHVPDLLSLYGWWNLVPDSIHQVVTAGYGTAAPDNEAIQNGTYATTAWITNGSLSISYCPVSTTLTVAMSKFAGPITARWYDPTNGTFTTISGSPFANTGAGNFTTPGQNSDGDSDWVLVLQTSADIQPPTAPSNLTATAISGGQINLSWTASTDNVGVAGYLVERCQGAACSNFAQIAMPTGVTYNDPGLAGFTNYSYRVRATDAAGNLSPYSNVASATTQTPDTQPPTAPNSLTATAVSSAQINLSWSTSMDNLGVTGYLVERCQGAGCTNFAQIANATSTAYNDTGLAAGIGYNYQVRATDAAGNLSPYSNVASATTLPPAATISYVQGNYAAPQSAQTTVNVTFTAAQAAGDLNVVVVGWNDSTASVSAVTDTPGNIYALAVGPTIVSGFASQSIYYRKNITSATAGGNTVTVTFSTAAAFPDIRILEYSGADANNPVDVTAASSGNSATSSSGSATTTNATDLLFGANIVATLTTGPGSGFATRVITSPDGDIVEDLMVAATGSYSATAPVSPAGQWIMQMVAFRTASAGAMPTCDLNSDGIVNFLDVQIEVNQVLGVIACTNGDLDGNGTCDVVDLQRVINAALGGGCRIGP